MPTIWATRSSIKAVDTGSGEYCTTTGGSSPAYAGRCYEITPTTDGAAQVRLWALTSELNGIAQADLAVYRNNPVGSATWVELTTNASTGNDVSGSYTYAQADTPGFSHFLLGQSGQAPTAVTLLTLRASSATPFRSGQYLVGLALLLIAAAMLLLRRRAP
jgi:hypothetical protein